MSSLAAKIIEVTIVLALAALVLMSVGGLATIATSIPHSSASATIPSVPDHQNDAGNISDSHNRSEEPVNPLICDLSFPFLSNDNSFLGPYHILKTSLILSILNIRLC